MSSSREVRRFRRVMIKLGVFVLISGFSGVVVFGTLLGEDVGTTDTYHADFKDISGLKSGDPVRVSGVVVGEVSDVHLRDAFHVDVTFTANRDQTLTTTTNAVVRYANLLGQRFLALTQTGKPGEPLRPGATIPQSHTAPALSLTALFNGFRPLFQSLDVDQVNLLTNEIVQVLQGETARVDDLIAQTAELTTNLADRTDVFAGVVDNLTTLLQTVAKHDDEFAGALDNLRTLADELAADSPNISKALDAIDGLAVSVQSLLSGVQQHGVTDLVADINRVAVTLSKNSALFDTTIKAFPKAFTVLDRVTQNGSWINAYPCGAISKTIGYPRISGADVADALSLYLTGKPGGLLSTLLKVLGLAKPTVQVPIVVPQGPIGNPNNHSAACK